MSVAAIIAFGMLAAVLAVMAGEAVLSSFNAAVLRSRGAVEPVTRTVTTACSMMSSWPSRTRAAINSGAVPMRGVER